ncbi:unconventional myosin-XV isoform X2 [Neocloeon triangulifer]|uniref:unconventional myosin-XV isoform X2 n=1 Tax=Neocloeon triangulifer TaxID=2078957 RepID=UPI00286F51FC|nr:unconventional myosin-XV isoform X2 [Neocloeon triangulifer]
MDGSVPSLDRGRYLDNITFYDAGQKSLIVTGKPSDASKNKVLASCSVRDVPNMLMLLSRGVQTVQQDDLPSRWRRNSCPGSLAEYSLRVLVQNPQVFTLTSMSGVKKRQDLGLTGLEDMIQLSDLNEASLLWNLKIRYDKELIYTYTGSILVAVNPYKMFDIYGLDMVKKYEGQIMGTLPPHLFAVGSCAYSRMSKDSESQVVVISGESGSGKTESTKLVMQYLAAVNKATSNLITEQILEASPLLESFGNAKTVKNDNSSRFGKYLDVHFKQGVIVGAKITEYLLEKSRIVTQAQDERNYHIFYEMLKGLNAEQKEKYGLLTPEKYFYLNQGGNCEIDGKNDLEDFQSLLSAMQVLGLNSEEQDTIFRILSSVLHLGNVYFHRKQLKHGQEGVEIGSDAEIRWAGHLLQLNVDGIKRSLTMKITEARNERLFTPLSIDQALDARDAFAKALYSTLFSWLVARINQIVCKGGKRTAISILDIFGFEDFKENSFEQLCINYANENLQFYFNKHIFKLEQQEYAKEKIEWQTITYTDNLPVIHLVAKKPVGILHLLDDESNFPKATDISFLEKCHYNHALNELYSRPRMSSMEFGVRHYAGQVWYNVEGFLDKNRDTLRQDVVDLLIGSKIPMVSKMFQSLRNYQETTKTLNKANGRFVTMKPRTPTVAARFHDSLQQLLDSMSKCNPWFVRCIKPNNEKAAMKFDMPTVLEQLRYTGMLETIRIRKTGYPVRLKFGQFVERYRYLLSPSALPKGTPLREVCRVILDREPENYQLGTHRVFLRETLERRLEEERARVLGTAVMKIQKNVRAYLARRKFQQQKKAAVTVQTAFRAYKARRNFRVKRNVALKAQANFRMKKERKRFNELKVELKRRAEVEKMARERAKNKAQKEDQDRSSRAVAGVTHLEIPAELAFIFSKLDDWQPIHSERNLVKVVGALPSRSDRFYLPHDIDHHAFTKFTNIYFKSHVWGMKREPIKTPFLAKSKDIDYQDSLAIFKLILRFMNDNNLSPKREQVLGDYIVNKGLISDKLRDEILCQLCNQTWKNENEANNERGWLLMANCLSCFPPSKIFYKYLLKYVSDSAYNGYKAICQRKLLQSARVECQMARAYPPSLLEWRANRKKVNMALEVQFPDGEVRNTPVESWITGEELAGLVIRDRGIDECHGWTVSCHSEDDNEGEVREMCGFDYVLDLVSEMELPPAFPVVKNYFLVSGKKGKRMPQFSSMGALTVDIDDHSPRRPVNPPPEPPVTKQLTRKMSHEVISEKWADAQQPSRGRSQSRDHTNDIGLSRKSALNDRYFEEKTRSRSLDNLLGDEPVPASKLKGLGLSQSKLNDRYRSVEKLEVPVMVHNQEYMSRAEVDEALESISQRGVSKLNEDVPKSQWSKFGLSGSNLNDRYFKENNMDMQSELGSEFSTPHIQPEFFDRRPRRPPSVDNGVSKRRVSASDFDNYRDKNNFNTGSTHDGQLSRHNSPSTSQLPSNGHNEFDFGHSRLGRGHPRFIKSHNAAKRTPGSHSSRNYLEKSEYSVKSSALSDTSEAPSLASHVRRVRVPSQASDVDQFLDDLFMPVLDGNLDELSDARSLAASIKGGGQKGKSGQMECRHEEEVDHEVASITQSLTRTRRGVCAASSETETVNSESVEDYIQGLLAPVSLNGSLKKLSSADTLVDTIKGGGDSVGGVETPGSQGQPKGFGFTPITGMTSPTPMGIMSGMMSPTQMMMPTIPVYTPAAQAAFMASGSLVASPGSPSIFSTPMGAEQASIPASLPYSTPAGQQQPFVPVPIYNMQGMNLPFNQMDPSQVAAYQQNLQHAFLQSAMAQNMQIQQQLYAQNQALQQMLHVQASPASSSRPNSNMFTPVSSKESGAPRKSSAKGTSQHAVFGSVLTELKNRKVSQDSVGKQSQSIPPPPPMPPAPENCDPSGSRPFIDLYGRAKTVRIGKWRWPPPKDSVEQNPDSFMDFKIRQHHRRSAQHQHPIDLGEGGITVMSYDRTDAVEWEEFEVEGPPSSKETTPAKKDAIEPKSEKSGFKAFEVGPRKTTPGSIGKLRISSEMRQKLELVTANHSSMRSTTKSEKPSLLPMKEHKAVKKLEDNRKLLLEAQLAGRWDTIDSVEAVTKDISVVPPPHMRMQDKSSNGRYEDNRRPIPPPPPVTPHFMEQAIHQHHPASRSSSFYSSNANQVPEPRSPPPPIQPIKSDSYQMQQRVQERRSSVSTHLTDKADRIEIEESSEFLQPVDSSTPVSMDREFARSLENIKTKLYSASSSANHFTYNRVNWKLHIRKEVFSPNEMLSNPLALHLVFCQVVQDALSLACIRISREERNKMRKMLDSYGITLSNLHSPHHKVTIKKNIVDIAKDWPTYFARIFPITGSHQNPDVKHLAVSHSGIRLIRREKSIPNDYLQVLDTFSFDEIAETSIVKGSALQIVLTSGTRYVFFTQRAIQIRNMIERYIVEIDKEQHEFVRAVSDHPTREPSLLAFRKGDLIKVVNKDQYIQKGWLYGSTNGRSGVFPCDLVEVLGRNEAIMVQKQQQKQVEMHLQGEQDGWTRGMLPQVQVPVANKDFAAPPVGRMSREGRSSSMVHDGKHSLLQFAMLHFRNSPEKFEMLKTADGSISGSLKVIESIKNNKKNKKKSKDNTSDWTWKEQVDMVKFSPEPPKQSLLRLESGELSDLAIECFNSIMCYMGDLPMPAEVTEVKCVYTILMHCHKHESLRDEVYCQIMKQTTNNKSPQPDSCQRGWRLFSIIAAYFTSSPTLKPYLFKYLETAAYDKRRAYHGTATVCLQNLRKTFKYGGRKNVPSVEEITAISAGRNSKRQIYRLPGGTERVINTKSTTVVQDIIEEICTVIGVPSGAETEEFSLYCIVEGDSFTMPLAREEYVLDVTTELHKNQQVFYLIFCRSVWFYPMRLESALYVEVVFNQVAPDYLEGLLLVMPGEQLDQELVYDIAKVAALLHRAADLSHLPTMKETKFLLPRPALGVRDIKPPQWVNMVQASWHEVEPLTVSQAKAQVLDLLSKWPLFGSSFFAVKRLSDPKERSDHILALNRHGVHFLDLITHETLMHYPFSEVISTRKVKSEDGILYLDMKCGNLMQQRITRLQTDQAHEISRLIRQYISMEQRLRGGPDQPHDHPADISLNSR